MQHIVVDTTFDLADAFMEGLLSAPQPSHQEEKDIREHLSERQIDKMVMDSFPASDPPSTY